MTEPRTAIVTGASSGIGRAIAGAFGALGWRVALGARRIERLDETGAEVRDAGGEPFTHYLDVADPSSIAAFFAAAEGALGGVDVLVNNAGVASPGWLDQIPVEEIEREVATNLLGPILATRLAVASMRARDSGGDVVFITSDATRHPRPRMATYTATKGGVEALASVLAMELRGLRDPRHVGAGRSDDQRVRVRLAHGRDRGAPSLLAAVRAATPQRPPRRAGRRAGRGRRGHRTGRRALRIDRGPARGPSGRRRAGPGHRPTDRELSAPGPAARISPTVACIGAPAAGCGGRCEP